MNYNAIEAAYRRFFGPRWDKMTPEEKANIDPETEVKIMNQLQQENLRGDAAYQRGFMLERERSRPRIVGANAQTWG